MTVHNLETPSINTLYPLNHLAIIEAAGDDVIQFLQGQLTCNIKELSDDKASIAAFCNPKGRVISTLLIIKTEARFLLILPRSLLDKVLNKLKMYVLRSKVQLGDKSDALSLAGLDWPNTELPLPTDDFQCRLLATGCLSIKLPSTTRRFLCIMDQATDASGIFKDFIRGNGETWRYRDISAGFPWFDLEQSERHIPQMLNIDQLGGISFNKGCYTGQEIVARTHYLGKAKRQLVLAECNRGLTMISNLSVKDAQTQEKIGEVLDLQALGETTRLLIVLQTVDGEAKNLILDDCEQTPVALISFQ
ncbi:CAF17-like 4Fe-4S cluster assembly/insertion protein YgfZ [Methylomonas rapida]|uniref:Folate-binding protein n=1 Tax=Methylomonas rapida TaxID=2963939 RepID=A0ABY7GPR6_9GAMM|nr:hypothetical protein [Methylomonas rapida]WAR46494.1 folate-binding protein [Methylomonas rapida]